MRRLRGGSRSYIVVSFALVTVLAMLSAATPPRMLTFGMLALGPALAAASANPLAVLALGGYAFVAAFAISSWQGLLGTLDQTLRLIVMIAITLIGWALARHHRGLQAVAAAAIERDIADKERRARAERMESLGHLAGGVAHDFNNLLAIILNYADLMADEVTPAGAADLARIRDAADRARALTGQLLLFAKREPTQVETVDLNTAVTDAQELLSRSIGGSVRLVCRPQVVPVPVRANRGRLDQILMNLVINARDAMPGGGDVTIRTDLVSTPLGVLAELSVSDTGTGMTAEVKERLFEPFFTTKPVDRGTGLGLSTVYGIVTDAGGTISVDSAPGAGTTFVIRLPLVPAVSPAALGAGRSS